MQALYDWLAREPSAEADEALAAALAGAEPAYVPQLAEVLFARRQEASWKGLICNCDRLTPAQRARLGERPDLLRAGLAEALKETAERARHNALALLQIEPHPRLAYAVADLLRTGSPDLQAQAARTLRRIAEFGLTLRGRAAAERAEMVPALIDALRTFAQHRQTEVLEACVWYAKELGQPLWDALADQHTQAGHVVAKRLKSWNHPRLAAFLLLGLARPAWRRVTLELLNAWHTLDELVAILRNSDLLTNSAVRRALQLLETPRWLTATDPALRKLPAGLRGLLPYWVCHLGMRDDERIRLLSQWQASALPEVHRAAVYALASLNTAEAARVLMRVAARPCPMTQFALWYVAGVRALAAYHRATVRRTTGSTAARAAAGAAGEARR